MYKSGEIYEVMKSFETSLKKSPIYVGGQTDRADMVEIEQEDGLIQKRFASNNYYNNGKVNELFLLFFQGYAAGKCAERING